DRQRERFFTIDVLAGLHGLDGDLRVPVVGGNNRHDVDVLAVEDLAVVLVHRDLAIDAALLVVFSNLLLRRADVADVHVTHGGNFAEGHHVGTDSPAPTVPYADASHDGPFVGRIEPQRAAAFGGKPVRQRSPGQCGQRGGLEKLTTTGSSPLHA